MRISLNYLKLKDDFNRIELLHWGHFSFIFLAKALELFCGASFIGWLVTTGILVVFYRFYSVTRKELFYSFWGFSGLLLLYLLYKIAFQSYEMGEIYFLYIMGLALLIIETYILSSPVYYPRVSWWEYDFRYRADLRVEISVEGNNSSARLTDLRRNAGCIASFEDHPVGTVFKISSGDYFDGVLVAEVISKRIYSLGRPHTYGVKFDLENEEGRDFYNSLLKVWRDETLQNRKRKFTKLNEQA